MNKYNISKFSFKTVTLTSFILMFISLVFSLLSMLSSNFIYVWALAFSFQLAWLFLIW